MMYVVCFYWQGERWKENGGLGGAYQNHLKRTGYVSNKLISRYINNLYKGVRRFASKEFKFICFTNENIAGLDSGVETRGFEMVTDKGVLPRLYMFSREAGLFGHQVLCLDLDIVITGSLHDLMQFDGTFCARSKFKSGEEYKLDGDIMSFQANKYTEDLFWNSFVNNKKEAEELSQGRERYWVRHVAGDIAERWDQHAPGQVVSYKWHVQKRGILPDNARIVSCHGYPRPHQINQPWIKEYWK